jgi:hypothetical protein
MSVRGPVDPRVIVWLEELGQLKNPVTSLGFKPAVFWLVNIIKTIKVFGGETEKHNLSLWVNL